MSDIIKAGLDIEKISKKGNKMFVKDADIIDISDFFDKSLKNYKFVSNPTSINLNHYAKNYIPIHSYKLKDTDIVSYELDILGSKRYKNIVLKHSHTVSIDRYKYSDLLTYTNEALLAGLKTCGPDVSLSEPRNAINEILDSYSNIGLDENGNRQIIEGIKTLINVHGYNLRNPKKIIPISKNIMHKYYDYCNDKMLEGELYYLPVFTTNLHEDYGLSIEDYPTSIHLTQFENIKDKKNRLITLKRKSNKDIILYKKLSSRMAVGVTYSIRSVDKIYQQLYKDKFDLGKLKILNKYGIIGATETWKLEVNKKENDKDKIELSKRKKRIDIKLNDSSYKMTKNTIIDLNKERDEIKEKLDKINNNSSIVAQFGSSFSITDKGITFLC